MRGGHRGLVQHHHYKGSVVEGDGILGDISTRTALAEHGSVRLKEAIQRLFERWEKANGFQAGAGQILLPAGYSE